MIKERLYVCSKQCRKCLRDYLFPAYGAKNYCNDCLMSYGSDLFLPKEVAE